MNNTIEKQCLVCNKTLKGRTDKKFCDDYCRNIYNNQLKSDQSNFVRNIINALRKNRLILQRLIGGCEKSKIPKEKLLENGYQFKYYTHAFCNKKGGTYHYCFEYGYLDMDRDWLMLVKNNIES